MDSAPEWARKNAKKYKTKAEAAAACAKATGFKADTISKALRKHFPGQSVSTITKPGANRCGRSMSEFRQTFDIPLRIKQGIKKHLTDCYMTDTEFREACGVHPANWRRYAEADEFKACRGRFSGQLFWASTAMMAKMKHIAGIPQEV